MNLEKNISRIKNKERSIKDLHNMWLLASDRSDKKNKQIIDYIQKIVKAIPENHRNEIKVYYKNDDGQTYEYTFTKSNYGTYGWGFSHSYKDGYSKDVKIARKEKIYFITNRKGGFEMGEIFHYLDISNKYLHRIVKRELDKKVNNYILDKYYKKNNNRLVFHKTFLIEINNKKYFINSEGSVDYPKFNLGEEFEEENLIVIK